MAAAKNNPSAISRFFISYAHAEAEERELAAWLCAELRKAGHEVFIDTDIALGARWGAEIERRINWCNFMVVLLSEAAASSEMVTDEIRRARNRHRKEGKPHILPVRVNFDFSEDPGYELASYLQPIQAMTWESQADSARVLEAILRAAADPAAPLPPSKSSHKKTKKKPAFPRPKPQAASAPSGSMWADDPFYLPRAADEAALKLATDSGVTLIIEAPRQIGKSSLLQRYLAECERAGKSTATVDLAGLQFDSFAQLLTGIADELSAELDLDAAPEIADQQKLTVWVQREILKRTDEPLTLAFDEADSIFGKDYSAAFFAMLRAWHNRRARLNSPWRKLDLALVISTEPHLLIDEPTLSPFNVGNHIRLQPFTPEECLRLNQLHHELIGRRLTNAQVAALRELLGGQPFLTRLAYHLVLVEHTWKLDELLAAADRDDSPFSDHLRALLSRLHARPAYDLATALKDIIRTGQTKDASAIDRLAAAGLVRRTGQHVAPANGLYARFFGRML